MRREACLALALLLLGACNRGPDLEAIWTGRWTVTNHEVAPQCEAFEPADPAWSGLEIDFVDLEGFLGMTVARCEGGCDTPSAAVALDVLDETELSGLDTEVGLFNSPAGEVCQGSLIDVQALLQGDGSITLSVRSYFGSLTPPADGDCQTLIDTVAGDLCDEITTFEAER